MRRAQRLKKKLVSTKLGRVVEGDKVRLTLLWAITEVNHSACGYFGCQAYYARQENRNARGLRRDEARKARQEANKPPAPLDESEAVQQPEVTEADWEARRVATGEIIAELRRKEAARKVQPEPKPKPRPRPDWKQAAEDREAQGKGKTACLAFGQELSVLVNRQPQPRFTTRRCR